MKWALAFGVMILTAACGGASTTDTSRTATETSQATGDPSTASGEPVEAEAPPAVRELTIPAGTALRLDLTTALASDQSKVEEPVRATLRQAVMVDNQTVLPVGTELSGVVTGVERSGRVKGRAAISFRFNTLSLGGESYKIQTSPIGRQAEATKGQDAAKIGIGAGAGAVIGGILGGGDGAATGAAIGGAAGTGTVLATRGKEVKLGPGANVATTLTAPLVVKVKG